MLRRFYRCEAAAVAVEYSILVGLIGLGITGAAWVLRSSIEAGIEIVIGSF